MAFGGGNDGGNGKKKKVAIMGASALILVAMVVAVAVGVHKGGSDDDDHSSSGSISTSSKAVKQICAPTDYRETCETSLSSVNSTDPKELIKAGFQVAVQHLRVAIENSTTLKELAKDPRANQALSNCEELMDYAIDDIQDSFNRLGAFDISKLEEYVEDLKVWLGGAVTYEQTCLDGFENTTGDAGDRMKAILKTAQELTSNGLAMVTEIYNVLNSNLNLPNAPSTPNPPHRRLLNEEETPSWVNDGKRKLLAASPADLKPDVVVAKDGSGKYKTVNEALKDIPKYGNNTFVIYIKAGVYEETVIIDKTMTHVMMIGDGPTKSVITGSKNYVDGTLTFKTATVSK